MENPCKKDCSRRSSDCHSYCPDYPKYQAFLKEKKALIKKSRIHDEYLQVKISDRITKDLKEKVRKR